MKWVSISSFLLFIVLISITSEEEIMDRKENQVTSGRCFLGSTSGIKSTKVTRNPPGSRSIFIMLCLLTMIPLTLSCSCLSSHPQEHFCSADFVSLVEVKKVSQETKSSTIYSIQVKKEFKTKRKGFIETGTFHTPSHETSCGRTFQPNTRYLITGRVINGQAWVSLCNYVEEWNKMTMEQRKGFKKWYSIGCSCNVRTGPMLLQKQRRNSVKNGQLNSSPAESKTCSWDTKFEGDLDCQGLHSICAPISVMGSLKRQRSAIGHRMSIRRTNGNRRSSVRRSNNPGHIQLNDVETESGSNEPNCHWIPSPNYRDCMRNRTEQADLHHQILKKYDERTKLREP